MVSAVRARCAGRRRVDPQVTACGSIPDGHRRGGVGRGPNRPILIPTTNVGIRRASLRIRKQRLGIPRARVADPQAVPGDLFRTLRETRDPPPRPGPSEKDPRMQHGDPQPHPRRTSTADQSRRIQLRRPERSGPRRPSGHGTPDGDERRPRPHACPARPSDG